MPVTGHARSRSASNNTARRSVTFESLESRQMMSATVGPSVQPHVTHAAPAGSVVNLNTPKPASASKSRHTAPGEPATDGKVTGWYNASSLPLFSSAGPSPLDVRQGAASDCAFLSALADTAYEDPTRIRQEVSERSNGTFDVFFWTGRQWTDENVDGYLPTNRSGRLEYAQLGQGNDTWVAIMEKAFAYFRSPVGSPTYTSINNLWPRTPLSALGASGTTEYTLSGISSGFSLAVSVYSDLASGRAVELATTSSSGPLVSLHAYSVMSVYENSSGYTYLLVRNPWGTDGPNHNGYQWVSTDTLLPQLSDVVSVNI